MKIFKDCLNKKIDYDGIIKIEKSIEDGIKMYQKNLVRIKIKEL